MTHAAIIFALTIILSVVELTLPSLAPAFPGVRLGLSNIAVMYSLFFIGKGNTFVIAALKGLFVFTVRGAAAGLLSLLGGLASVFFMSALLMLFKQDISYLMISVSGAVFHNIGQLLGIFIIYRGAFLWAYLPILIIAGIAAGTVTSILLRITLPAFSKTINYKSKRGQGRV